jgi:predicted Zn-dependent protease
MKPSVIIPLLAALLLMLGCTTTPRQTPAPILGPGQPPPAQAKPEPYVPPAVIDGGTQLRPYQPPADQLTSPAYGKAVAALVAEAERQRSDGDLVGAAGSIERALRIEPRNAHLWNRLAHLRMQQGQGGMAADLAAKSISLAGGDIPLQRNNWELIARARYAAGDVAGGRVADRKARMLR